MLRRGSGGNAWIMLLMVVCGLVVGGFLGELLGNYFPVLAYKSEFQHEGFLLIIFLAFNFINMFVY